MPISYIMENETWNTCPACYDNWKDEEHTPGLLHRTKLCDRCQRLQDGGVDILGTRGRARTQQERMDDAKVQEEV